VFSGMALISSIQANSAVRDMTNLYIHGADFSTSSYQTLAQTLASGLNLQFPTFGSGVTNIQSNTGTSGNGIIWVSQVMWIGSTSDANCVAVGASNCTNANSFVFTQQIVFGNSNLTSTHDTTLGYPTGASISSSGNVSNYVTDSHAALSGTAQSQMQSLWQTTSNGQTALVDGQVLYVVEGYFSTPALHYVTNGVYSRYFF